jgi:hypothetical protein
LPPKQKITKEIILDAAFQVTKEKGFGCVNARSIATVIGCSTQPVFSHYTSMLDLKREFYRYLERNYNQYAVSRVQGDSFFPVLGLSYIVFAKNDTNLFQVLFMSECTELNGLSDILVERNLEVSRILSKNLGISMEEAKNLFMKLWFFVHGIASMIATKSMYFSDTETEKMQREAYEALLKQVKIN